MYEDQEILMTEQVETPQETVETPKMYTEAEMNARVDELLGKKLARKTAKIEKEYSRKFGELTDVLKAGMGKDDIGEITSDLREFYGERKGIKMPEKPNYTAEDIEVLARADADDIIRSGYDEVVEEVDRLSDIGLANMTAREKAAFKALAEYRQTEERRRDLSAIGVTEDVYGSAEFKDFASKFSPNTPIKDIYDIYAKTQPRKEYKTMGSMKQVQDTGVKDYYTPEEIDRMTEADLDDPRVWAAVRRSMTGG